MTIILRSEKKSPLTVEELDNNFKELHNRLAALEQGTFAVESLKKVVFEGHELVFTSTFDREIGRCTLPALPLQARGRWQSNQDYIQGDIVTLNSQAFVCFKPHKSQESQSPDAEKWQLILDGEFLKEQGAVDSHQDTPPSGEEIKSTPQKKHTIPLYEKETLPKPHLGQVGLLLTNKETPQFVYATGQKWQPVSVK